MTASNLAPKFQRLTQCLYAKKLEQDRREHGSSSGSEIPVPYVIQQCLMNFWAWRWTDSVLVRAPQLCVCRDCWAWGCETSWNKWKDHPQILMRLSPRPCFLPFSWFLCSLQKPSRSDKDHFDSQLFVICFHWLVAIGKSLTCILNVHVEAPLESLSTRLLWASFIVCTDRIRIPHDEKLIRYNHTF